MLFGEIKKKAQSEKAIFLRASQVTSYHRHGGIPPRRTSTSYKLSKTIDIQPSRTSILDLNAPEEELLRNMHPKTRYNIRLAEKRKVTVREGA